jgi:hypothetical protein
MSSHYRLATATTTTDTTTAMAPDVLASDAQQLLFREWAKDSVFVLGVHESPKQQFNILAKLLNWVGGEEPWNTHWQECFDEVYVWRARSKYASFSSRIVTEDIQRSLSRLQDPRTPLRTLLIRQVRTQSTKPTTMSLLHQAPLPRRLPATMVAPSMATTFGHSLRASNQTPRLVSTRSSTASLRTCAGHERSAASVALSSSMPTGKPIWAEILET